MAVMTIRTIGDPVLRTRAAEVTEFGPELSKLVADMEETMEDVSGAGLAAPQVGVSLRVFTFRVGSAHGHVVNPVLELDDDEGGSRPEEAEGCLSIPGLGYPVPRNSRARVRGVDRSGAPVEYEGTGMLARCFQHETDHLNGTLYLDRLVGEHRKAAMRAIRSTAYTAAEMHTAAQRAQSIGSSFGAGAVQSAPGRRTPR